MNAVLTSAHATPVSCSAHHFRPPSQWVLSNSNTLSADDLRTVVKNHVSNVMGHYVQQGMAYAAVDVVNEACSDSGTEVLKNVQPWYLKVTDYTEERAAVVPQGDGLH